MGLIGCYGWFAEIVGGEGVDELDQRIERGSGSRETRDLLGAFGRHDDGLDIRRRAMLFA